MAGLLHGTSSVRTPEDWTKVGQKLDKTDIGLDAPAAPRIPTDAPVLIGLSFLPSKKELVEEGQEETYLEKCFKILVLFVHFFCLQKRH